MWNAPGHSESNGWFNRRWQLYCFVNIFSLPTPHSVSLCTLSSIHIIHPLFFCARSFRIIMYFFFSLILLLLLLRIKLFFFLCRRVWVSVYVSIYRSVFIQYSTVKCQNEKALERNQRQKCHQTECERETILMPTAWLKCPRESDIDDTIYRKKAEAMRSTDISPCQIEDNVNDDCCLVFGGVVDAMNFIECHILFVQ